MQLSEEFWFILTKINASLTGQRLHCDVILVIMLLQIVIEFVYYFLLPMFTEECKRLLSDIQQDAWGFTWGYFSYLIRHYHCVRNTLCYQIILFGNRETSIWTAYLVSMSKSMAAGSITWDLWMAIWATQC